MFWFTAGGSILPYVNLRRCGMVNCRVRSYDTFMPVFDTLLLCWIFRNLIDLEGLGGGTSELDGDLGSRTWRFTASTWAWCRRFIPSVTRARWTRRTCGFTASTDRTWRLTAPTTGTWRTATKDVTTWVLWVRKRTYVRARGTRSWDAGTTSDDTKPKRAVTKAIIKMRRMLRSLYVAKGGKKVLYRQQ